MLPSLNGLRAVSVLLVLFAHALLVKNVPMCIKSLFGFFANGEMGVRFFFVISGYLITHLLLLEFKTNGKVNIKKFYIRRTLRIFPVFYSYILFILLTAIVIKLQVNKGLVLSSLLYLQNFAPWGSDWLIAHSWSLAVEEQFYLLWPAVLLFFRFKVSTLFFILCGVFGILSRSIRYKYPEFSEELLLPFLGNFDFIAGGCWLAFAQANNTEWVSTMVSKLKAPLLLIGFMVVFIMHRYETHPTLDRILIPITGSISIIYFLLLIAWVVKVENQMNLLCKALNSNLMFTIGKYSYGLYVWQQLFLVPEYHETSTKIWTQFPLNIVLFLFCVLGSYQLIEKPFLRLKLRYSV